MKRLLARLAIAWERIWPRFWPAASIAGLFLAVALFDLLPALAGWLHIAVLAAFGAAFLASLWWGFRGLRLPSSDDVQRRLETASGLDHRPLLAIEDDMAVGQGDGAAEALWRAHQARAREALKNVRVGNARPPVARRDPWALRGAVVLLLAVAGLAAWEDAPARLERAISPGSAPVAAAASNVTVEAWVTPPGYTGRAPRMMDAAAMKKPLIVPRGTKLMIQVHGRAKQPVMTVGRQRVIFKALGKTSFQGEVMLYYPGRVVVEQDGDRIVSWAVQVMGDSPPTIAWAKDAKKTQGVSVRFDYTASDDYRVARVRAYIARRGETDVITLRLPVAGGKKAKGSAYRDLSSHRWAGLPVAIVLEVEDDSGQVGVSKIRQVTLPQRAFSNPVARELVRQRMLLTMDPNRVRQVIKRMDRLATRRKMFKNDPTAYLGLRSAQGRLIIGTREDGQNDADHVIRRDKAIREAQALMWGTALRIEEGGLSELERRLRRLQRELADRLSRQKVDPKELQKLMDKLRQAMREYMKALREDMRKNPQKYANRPFNPNDRTMSNKDIERMMQQLRDMLRRGDKENAQRLLSQLRQLMEQLRANNQGRPMDPNHPALKMMRKFGDLIRRQQKLMDDTHKRAQQRRDGKANPKEDKRLKAEQEKLRRELAELMRRLGDMTGKVPRNLGRAEQEMRRAEGRLKGQQPGRAVGPQSRALEQLRRGAQRAMRQMARRFGMRPGRGLRAGRENQRPGRDRDPLGRRLDGMGPLDDNNVKVPTDAQRKKARDILDELRRRSGDGNRPKIELDYLDRLLRQF